MSVSELAEPKSDAKERDASKAAFTKANVEELYGSIKPLDFAEPYAPTEIEREYFRFYGINFEETMPGVEHFLGSFPAGSFDIVGHYFRQADAKGTCYIVHGYYDHVGLFGHLIEFCLQSGMSVVAFDLPGHGLSTGTKASIENFNQYQEALAQCLRLSDGVVAAPYSIMGQSTGGAIAMQYLLDQRYTAADVPFNNIVLLAPLVRPATWQLSKMLFHISRLFVTSVPRSYSANSHDQDFLNFVRKQDPLQCEVLPVAWVAAMRDWMKAFLRMPRSSLEPLIIQGQQDHTVDWRFNIAVIRKKFPSSRVYYVKDGRHHLVNESAPIRERIFRAVALLFAES